MRGKGGKLIRLHFCLFSFSGAFVFLVGAISTPAQASLGQEGPPSSFPASSGQSATPELSGTKEGDAEATTEKKRTNINLLRKLWSSTRSSKLNLTHEHHSLLRIESHKSNRSISPGRNSPSSVEAEDADTSKASLPQDLPEVPLTRESPTPSSHARGVRLPILLYPEWLSSGGVYPDDSNANGTAAEYYGEVQYENLISSSGSNGVVSVNGEGREESGEEVGVPRRGNVSRGGDTPEAVIAGSGMADVISRGRIDSVMYVYFGDRYNDDRREEVAGRVIQVNFPSVGWGLITNSTYSYWMVGCTRSIAEHLA